MRERGLPLENLARWMSAQPAKLAGLEERKGSLAAGYDADLVVFDPDAQFTLSTEDLQYRHLVSPYLGENLYGKVRADVPPRLRSLSAGIVPGSTHWPGAN